MPKYKITIKHTEIYDCIVDADSLEDAKELAWDIPEEWSHTTAGWMEHGKDHEVMVDGEWKEASA
jgi:hypothetical protein